MFLLNQCTELENDKYNNLSDFIILCQFLGGLDLFLVTQTPSSPYDRAVLLFEYIIAQTVV